MKPVSIILKIPGELMLDIKNKINKENYSTGKNQKTGLNAQKYLVNCIQQGHQKLKADDSKEM